MAVKTIESYPYLCPEGQFDITEGLEQCSREQFVNNAVEYIKNTYKNRVTKTFIYKELAGVNRRNGIIFYHTKGFVFRWKELKCAGINWGKYYSMFHLDHPTQIPTIGGNFVANYHDETYNGMAYAIHPNIYRKPSSLKLKSEAKQYIIRMCISYEQEPHMQRAASFGAYNELIQIVRNMFNNNEPGDGLWHMFGKAVKNQEKVCDICGDAALVDRQRKRCKHCLHYV